MWHKVIVWFAVADLISLIALVAWWVIKGELPEWKRNSERKSRILRRGRNAQLLEQSQASAQSLSVGVNQLVINEQLRIAAQAAAQAMTNQSPPVGPTP